MEGFLVFDYSKRYEQARADLTGWITSGQLNSRHTDYHGLDAAPQAFVDLLAGRTIGTTIVGLGD